MSCGLCHGYRMVPDYDKPHTLKRCICIPPTESAIRASAKYEAEHGMPDECHNWYYLGLKSGETENP